MKISLVNTKITRMKNNKTETASKYLKFNK